MYIIPVLLVVFPCLVNGFQLRLRADNPTGLQISVAPIKPDEVTTDPQPIQVDFDENGKMVTVDPNAPPPPAKFQPNDESVYKISTVMNHTIPDDALSLNVTLDDVLFCKTSTKATTTEIFGCVGPSTTTPGPYPRAPHPLPPPAPTPHPPTPLSPPQPTPHG